MWFVSNIDCAKRHISILNNASHNENVNPLVGDIVVIHQSLTSIVEMVVIRRVWRHLRLEVELGLSSQFSSISDMERLLSRD